MIAALFLAIALAMDAVAVAMVQGAVFRPAWRQTLLIAVMFGVFQGVMPVIGWGLAELSLEWIAAIDHWIAFVILGGLGLRMLFDGDEDEEAVPLGGLALVLAAIAESIDALAAGVTLPTIGLPIALTCTVIGVVTTLLVEIYTGLASREAANLGARTKLLTYADLNAALDVLGSAPVDRYGDVDDHSSDALLTAAWLRKVAGEKRRWEPRFLTAQIAYTEGWTFGAL